MRVTDVDVSDDRPRQAKTASRTWGSSIQSGDGGPFTSSLLTGLVENLGNDGLTVIILELEDGGSDLDEERVENTLVPLEEDVGDFILVEAESALQDIIAFGNKLHVTVLDTWRFINLRSGNRTRFSNRCEPS